jgi:hypothetical protein
MQTLKANQESFGAQPQAGRRSLSYCEVCRRAGWLITAEKAAAIGQCSRRRIYRWLERGLLHFTELTDGTVLICGRSLLARLSACDNATVRLSVSQLPEPNTPLSAGLR